MKKLELVEKLASNHHQMAYDKTVRKSTPGVLQMDALSTLSTQISTMNKKIQMLDVQSQANSQMAQVLPCDCCGQDHPWYQCPLRVELVNYIGNFNMNQNKSLLVGETLLNLDGFGNQSSGQKLQTQVQSQTQIQSPQISIQCTKQNATDDREEIICGRSNNTVHAKQAVVNTISTSIHEELGERNQITCQCFEQHITQKLPRGTKVPRLESGKEWVAELRSGKKLSDPYIVPTRGGEEKNRIQCMEENEDGWLGVQKPTPPPTLPKYVLKLPFP